MQKKVIVIGGGAAGMMAAGTAAQNGATVILIEKNEKPGKKIYITGKGRCNISNSADRDEFLKNVVNGNKFLMSAISNFSFLNLENFFAKQGLNLKIERGKRVFPKSDKASDVTKALEKFCTKNDVQICLNETVLNVKKNAEKFEILTNKNMHICDSVIVATGGLSYPLTGSTGDGYKFAKHFKIEVINQRPALVPIEFSEDVKCLEGLSLKNVKASVFEGEKILKNEFGELVFTFNGISGPLALTLSSYINNSPLKNARLCLDLKPALTHEMLNKRLLRDFKKMNNFMLKNYLKVLLPCSLIPYFISIIGINENKVINQITSKEREVIIRHLKCLQFNIKKLYDISVGIVTAGGICLSEINPKTMESKKVKGLYFAGEVLDVDALTGGFNIHIALATGKAAGEHIS